MTAGEHYKERYRAGDTPWDIGKPDFNVTKTVVTLPIKPCRALDVGCGTGDNAIWLSQQNFDVLGIDASDVAIENAKEKALRANVKCAFSVIDILTDGLEGAPFDFVFDRGCFHSLDSDKERKGFVEKVSGHLAENGLWLSLLGNADERRHGPGPPQRTARDIVNCVEPFFEILSLTSSYFGSNRPNPPRAWVCLTRKRLS